MLKELIEKAEREGGATYQYINNYYPSTGYAVAIHKEKEQRVPALTEIALIHFIHENYDLLLDRYNFLGIWHNDDDGMYYLDIVTVATTYFRALTIAKENKQKAFYDLETGKTINIEDYTPLFEFDELLEGTQDQCIQDYLKSPTLYEVAIDDLRHMKFGVNGNIVKGYDE